MSNSSTATGPKLRDSCDACASSKLKCHKQKPTCSRCEKRGIQCNYLATRRAGRKYDSRRAERKRSTTSVSAPQTSPDLQLDQLDFQLEGWFGTTSSGTPTNTGDDYFQGSTPALSTGTASILSSGLNSGLLSPAPLDYSGLMGDLDAYLQTPASLWIPDISGADMFGQRDADFFSVPATLSDTDDHNKQLGNFDPSTQLIEQHSSRASSRDHDSQQKNGDPRTETPLQTKDWLGCCLVRAMNVLQHLFPQSRTVTGTACTNRDTNQQCTTTSETQNLNLPSFDTVITHNKKAMDAVGTMLQCACSQDGYLLAIMSLIAFKVLDAYSAAVTNKSLAPTEPAAEEDPAYMAAQTVLGELHHVQRLINQLSTTMKEQSAQSCTGAAQDQCGLAAGYSVLGGSASMPFSSIMLDHLEADMRKRLKRLSSKMIEHLTRD